MVFRYGMKGMTDIGEWLKKMGACAAAIPSFEHAPGIGSGVASIKKPDWFLWFYFAQAGADLGEKKRLMVLLHSLMRKPILEALSKPDHVAAATAALDFTLKDATVGHSAATEGRARLAAFNPKEVVTPKERASLECARLLLSLALTKEGFPSAITAGPLGIRWMQLLGVGEEAATESLRKALPLNNKSSFPT